MEANNHVQPAPVPLPFSVDGTSPGPRCGHTLTVVLGSEQRLSNSKLVMFGAGPSRIFGAQPADGVRSAASGLTRKGLQAEQLPWKGLTEAHSPQQQQLVRFVACSRLLHAQAPGLGHGRFEFSHRLVILISYAGIRLAGATNDVHVMDFPTGKWTKIEPQGELPAPRAAHAAVAVGSMMVVQVCDSQQNATCETPSACLSRHAATFVCAYAARLCAVCVRVRTHFGDSLWVTMFH